MDQGQSFYKNDLQKLTFGELRYFMPGAKGVLLWACKTIGLMRLPVIPIGTMLPIRANTVFSSEDRLSDRCRELISPQVDSFKRLGFTTPCFEENKGFNEDIPDGGGCHLAHTDGHCIATVVYLLNLKLRPEEMVVLTIWSMLENGRSLGVSNQTVAHDPFANKVLGRTVVFHATESAVVLFDFFEKTIEPYRSAPGLKTLRSPRDIAAEFEKDSIKVLDAGLRQNRYSPMSEGEIREMKKKYHESKQSALGVWERSSKSH